MSDSINKEVERIMSYMYAIPSNTSYAFSVKEDSKKYPMPKEIIFNPPATIVYFTDGTKVVVKCNEDEEFVPEYGLAMAVLKKMYNGNRNKYLKFVNEAWDKHLTSKKEKFEKNEKLMKELFS